MLIIRGLRFLIRHLFYHPRFLFSYAVHFFASDYTFKVNFYQPNELRMHLAAGKSIIRMGDGEVYLMNGGDLGFQRYHPELARMLFEIISTYTDQSRYVLGVNEIPLIRTNKEMREKNLLHSWLPSKVYYDLYYNKRATYIDASVFYYNDVIPSHLGEYLASKHLVVVTKPENIDTFRANSQIPFTDVSFVETPATHAYDEYATIRNKVQIDVDTHGKERTVVLAAFGPASKVLAYELSEDGVVVIDIGHGLDIAYSERKIDYIANPFLTR